MADTGPLIGLARVDKLDLLRLLYGSVVVPPAVREELGIESGYPGANVLSAALTDRWITVHSSQGLVIATELADSLDPGEAEAISLAEERAARFLLIDDAKGRRFARQRGLPVVGVAGVLLAAKSAGILAAVAPVLRNLSSAGYRLSPELMSGVLQSSRRVTAIGADRSASADPADPFAAHIAVP